MVIAAVALVVIALIVFGGAIYIEFGADIRRGLRRLATGRKEIEMAKYNDNPAIYPFRIISVNGRVVPRFPAECERHSLRCQGCWVTWAMTRDQRQCRGCGLWAIWMPRAITKGSHDA